MVSTMKMLTTTPFTPNLRISLLSTRLFLQFHYTFLLLPGLVMFTVSTSQVTLSFTLSFLLSTRSMSRILLEPRRTNLFSWSSTVDLGHQRSTTTLLAIVLLRLTLILICSTLTSLASRIMFLTRRTTLCSKLATQIEQIS